MSLNKVTPGNNVPESFNVVVEIPMDSDPIKYEVDKDSGAIFVDRFMSTAMYYPCNYGYVPQTLSGDGDPVDVLVIAPSQPIDEIAARHRQELPAALRLFLRGPGATKTSGAGVLSYLLFEAGYCSELIELGRRDALAKREEITRFLGLA